MSMFATIKGPDGQVLGSVPVDPSQPGGINQQIRAAVTQMQQHGTIPQTQRHSPQRTPIVQDTPNQYAQQTVRMRFIARGPNGQPQWMEQVVPCPPGVMPGTYVFVGNR
jgi:hypothetical protein